MLCAPHFWLGRRGPWVSGALGILALMLCRCSGYRDYSPDEGILPGQETRGTTANAGEEPRQPAGFGVEGQTVPIFIHMDATEYSLPCSPKEMHVTNPTYRWARDRRESQSPSVSAQGALSFRHFQGGSSGNYSCTVSYKEHRVPRAQTFHYTVLAYHVRGGLEALLVFRSRLCQEALRRRFLWSLQEALGRVASAQHCQLVLSKSSCFPTLQEPWDEFNLQAKLTMTRFLEEHGPFPITGGGAPRAIFSNRFTSFLKTERCAGGYGLSLQLETCPDCCILCQPGTFSAPGSNECAACPVGTFNPLYGRVVCSRCKAGLVTRAAGATSAGDCVEEEVPVPLRIPVMVLIILLPPLGCSCLIILGCFWCHRCRQKQRTPPRAFGGTAVTATGAHAPKAPYAARPPDAAATARETLPPARSASAGAGLEDTPGGPYATGDPYTVASASKTISLASSPSSGAGKDTPRGPYTMGGPDTAAPASKTISLASSPSSGAGKDTPRGPYTMGGPDTAAPASKTISLASSPAAGLGMGDTPRAPDTFGAPGAAASSETLPLGASASALAGLQDTPRPTYAAEAPDTAAPASKTVSLASSPSAGAGKDTPRAPYAAKAPGETIPQGASAFAGASMEDLPPAPSPAEELSNGEFVFPSPPVFASPAGSNGNARRPS
ncbi:uncharacterized protein LOC120392226 isoform X2 [Mauremys reevesii]|uniref:uncharacterized protein LOC120392226 isoform X2 n=1 Tax=Mauremys reevesii TaxID=260615 RepID=UPI00193FFD43|nr:uncharacterized protein LOC120392226 isoform X2 [Mauremys reevesii]